MQTIISGIRIPFFIEGEKPGSGKLLQNDEPGATSSNYKEAQMIMNHYINSDPAITLDIFEQGAFLELIVAPENQKKICQQMRDGGYKIGCAQIDSILLFTIQIGNSDDIIRVPFSPHFSSEIKRKNFPKNEGIPLYLHVIDNVSGGVVKIDLLGLAHYFSKNVSECYRKLLKKSVSESDYEKSVSKAESMTDDELKKAIQFQCEID